MKNIFLFIFCFSLPNPFLFAEQNLIDSLENLLKTTKEDTLRINLLNKLAGEYLYVNADKTLEYATLALKKCEQIHLADSTSNFFINKATTNALNSIGSSYYLLGNYDDAMMYFVRALKIAELQNDTKSIATGYNNAALIYQKQMNNEKALEYYFKALEIDEKTNNKKGIAIRLNNIGIIYKEQEDYDKALEYALKTLKITEELGDEQGLVFAYSSIANAYFAQKNFDKALETFLKCIKMEQALNDNEGAAIDLNNVANIYWQKGNYQKAIDYSKQSLAIAQENGLKDYMQMAYRTLSEVYENTRNYQLAYNYHQLYSQIKDSLFNEESSKQITEMQTKYETEKKEQQIKLLNKDKEIQTKDLERQKTIRNAVAGGLILVLLFSFVLINRLLLIRKQKKIIEIEREKSEKLLLNILPKDTADELKRNNAVTPKRYDQVTVMFTDFKGFTTIAEKMTAEELVSELDFIFKKFDEIISKYPIEKIKTIGDAYMCAGGLPVANTTNSMDLVLAALEICEFMEKLAVDSSQLANGEKKLQTANWKLRIGIHTGSVIAGIVGAKKFAYDIWGDAVNTASRMESSGEAGKVNISGDTYKNLAGFENLKGLQFQFRGKIPAKNKGEIEMYFVEKV